MFVNIIVVTHNRYEHLKKCIESIAAQKYKQYDITVIDNNSSDLTNTYLLSQSDKIKIISLSENIGCPAARNLGIQVTSGDIVLFVDDDGALEENVLETVVNEMVMDENIGVVVCGIWENDHWLIRPIESEQKNRIYLPMFYGQCAIKREVLTKTGLYPGDFYYGAEEVDLSLKILKNGYQIVFQPKAITYHFRAETGRFKGQSIYKEKNLLKVYLKYSPFPLILVHFVDKGLDYLLECYTSGGPFTLFKEIIQIPLLMLKCLFHREPIEWEVFAVQYYLNLHSEICPNYYDIVKRIYHSPYIFILTRFWQKYLN